MFSLLERWASSTFVPRQELIASDKVKCKEYRCTTKQIELMRSILMQYLGTHNHHNFTVGKKYEDPSASRYIMSFEVE
jgi:tRNA U38,U39,U40 pseudouridine synthase TruA